MIKNLPFIPFFKIFATLLLGVILSMSAPAVISFVSLCLLLFPLLLIRKYPSVSCYCMLLLLGGALPYLQKTEPLPLNRNCRMEVIISDTTSKDELFIGTLAENDQRLLLIFDKKQNISPGDCIKATILMEDVRFAHHQLKKHLPDKDVKLCAKVIELESVIPGSEPFRKRLSLPKKINRWCEVRLKQLNLSPQDIGIINGMLLGNREDIGKEQQEQYNNTGISHLLSISGMHIGILFMLLNVLLIFRNKSYVGRIVGSIFIVIMLWCYTLIVGAPLSALRATMMFTILQIGMMKITSPLQVFNTLFATATLFLLVDYNVIFDIGFQLSFISLLSILLFLPLMGKSNYFIDILYVTLSAQILTTPLILHYFGYFSVISVVANLFGAVAIYGIMLLSIAFIAFPNSPCEWTIKLLFDCFNRILRFLSDLPWSHIDNISFSVTDITIYYLIVYLIYDFIFSSTKKHI